MKVTCILTSYNRPRMVRDALKSIADQTHKDYELLVYDDSTVFDIKPVVAAFPLTEVRVFHNDLSAAERRAKCRLGVNCNAGLGQAKGDLVCFLCDDDFYWPGWFEAAVRFFTVNPDKEAGFGKLKFIASAQMVFPKAAHGIWREEPVAKPHGVLDHNQVIHRRFIPPYRWPEDFKYSIAPDGIYFSTIASSGRVFHPIRAEAVVKRAHSMNLQKTLDDIGSPAGEGLRERFP
jgi:glycosyltransferase involved in cell wall biosynthesis